MKRMYDYVDMLGERERERGGEGREREEREGEYIDDIRKGKVDGLYFKFKSIRQWTRFSYCGLTREEGREREREQERKEVYGSEKSRPKRTATENEEG